MRRSMLFVPGNTPNLIINSNCMGADAIIFDLEDAVAPARVIEQFIKLQNKKLLL